eukprot:9485156-Pyramimonas_sp.AAC.2
MRFFGAIASILLRVNFNLFRFIYFDHLGRPGQLGSATTGSLRRSDGVRHDTVVHIYNNDLVFSPHLRYRRGNVRFSESFESLRATCSLDDAPGCHRDCERPEPCPGPECPECLYCYDGDPETACPEGCPLDCNGCYDDDPTTECPEACPIICTGCECDVTRSYNFGSPLCHVDCEPELPSCCDLCWYLDHPDKLVPVDCYAFPLSQLDEDACLAAGNDMHGSDAGQGNVTQDHP